MGKVAFWKTMILSLFAMIDKIVYTLVAIVTQEFFNMTTVKFMTESTMQNLTNRMYVVVSVFMVFRLMFSLAQALVNPDSMNDKKSGLGTIATRTVTAVALLLFIPMVFNTFLYGSTNGTPNQQVVADILPRLILGTGTTLDPNAIGQNVATATLSAFMQQNEGCPSASNDLDKLTASKVAEKGAEVCPDDKTMYSYDYTFIVSTIAGIVLLVVLIGYTIDIAVRGLKLVVLQMIAPIPIIMYIDPNQSKDGTFNNWLKATLSTYADLYIKLATIYFAIYFVSKIIHNVDNFFPSDMGLAETGYLTVFLIIGIFVFVLQLPKFVKGLFGIKDQGLGAGLGAVLGAGGALLAGGGIKAAMSAGAKGASDGSEGKASVAGSFNQGSELGRKLSGKPTRQERQIQRNQEKLAKKNGFTDAYDKANEQAGNLETQAQEAELRAAMYAQGDQSEKAQAARKIAVQTRQSATTARANADKIKSWRDDPRKAITQGHGTRSTARIIASSAASTGVSAAGAVAGTVTSTVGRATSKVGGAIQSHRDVPIVDGLATAGEWVGNKASSVGHAVSGAGHTIGTTIDMANNSLIEGKINSNSSISAPISQNATITDSLQKTEQDFQNGNFKDIIDKK